MEREERLPGDDKTALEKELIQKSLAKHKGHITRIAVELGVNRPTLHELLTRYNIER